MSRALCYACFPIFLPAALSLAARADAPEMPPDEGGSLIRVTMRLTENGQQTTQAAGVAYSGHPIVVEDRAEGSGDGYRFEAVPVRQSDGQIWLSCRVIRFKAGVSDAFALSTLAPAREAVAIGGDAEDGTVVKAEFTPSLESAAVSGRNDELESSGN